MAEALTSVYHFVKPDIGGSQTTWGNRLNKDLDDIDAILALQNSSQWSGLQNGLNTATVKEYDNAGNVTGSLPLTDDRFRTAGAPLMYTKAITDDLPTFIPPNKPGYLVPQKWVYQLIDAVLPVGAMITWYGTEAGIPPGWHIADGSTVPIEGNLGQNIVLPDMRGRFQLGGYRDTDTAADNMKPGSPTPTNGVAGQFIHTHPITVNNTTLTAAQIPEHRHSTAIANADSVIGTFPGNGTITMTSGSGTNYGITTIAENYSAGGSFAPGGGPHNHTASSGNNTTPGVPWYALFYIVKIRQWSTYVPP